MRLDDSKRQPTSGRSKWPPFATSKALTATVVTVEVRVRTAPDADAERHRDSLVRAPGSQRIKRA